MPFLLIIITIPAISLWDFLNRDSDLVAQVSTCIDYPVSAFSQNDSVAIFVIFIVILQKEKWGKKIDTLVTFYILNIEFSQEHFSLFQQIALIRETVR